MTTLRARVGEPHHGFSVQEDREIDAIVRAYSVTSTPHTRDNQHNANRLAQESLSLDDDPEDFDPFQVEILARTSRWILKQNQAPKPQGDAALTAADDCSLSPKGLSPKQCLSPDMQLGQGFRSVDPFDADLSMSFDGPLGAKIAGFNALREFLDPLRSIAQQPTQSHLPPPPPTHFPRPSAGGGEIDPIAIAAALALPPPDPVGRFLPRRMFPMRKGVGQMANPVVNEEELRLELYRKRLDLEVESIDGNSSFGGVGGGGVDSLLSSPVVGGAAGRRVVGERVGQDVPSVMGGKEEEDKTEDVVVVGKKMQRREKEGMEDDDAGCAGCLPWARRSRVACVQPFDRKEGYEASSISISSAAAATNNGRDKSNKNDLPASSSSSAKSSTLSPPPSHTPSTVRSSQFHM